MSRRGSSSCRHIKDKSVEFTIPHAIIICLGLVFLVVMADVYNDYLWYHTQMHGKFTWGVITSVNYHVGKGYYTRIEYNVNNNHYQTTVSRISARYLGDSVWVLYDSTRPKEANVPLRYKGNAETAFFKSEERISKMLWDKQFNAYCQKLDLEREKHLRREHFYDYLCKDD